MNLQIFQDFVIDCDILFESRPKGWAYSQVLIKFKQFLNGQFSLTSVWA